MRYFLIALCLFQLSSICYAEQYLCIGEESAGFSYEKNIGKWKGQGFTNKPKYILKSTAANDYKVFKFGEDTSSASCVGGFNEYGYLFCEGWFDFKMNKVNKRFVIVSTLFSYISVGVVESNNGDGKIKDEVADSSYMVIGKCSPF